MSEPLFKSWQLLRAKPNEFSNPGELPIDGEWIDALVPGTVAQSLERVGQWSLTNSFDLDDYDWWYRCELSDLKTQEVLRFHGLATIADIWLNGEKLLSSDNMFRTYDMELAGLDSEDSELVICFHSLNARLNNIKSRPKWKTQLVSQQQLRWFRTTLIGRIPGWMPTVAPIGPWRAIERINDNSIDVQKCVTTIHEDVGQIDFKVRIQSKKAISKAELVLSGQCFELTSCVSGNKLYETNASLENLTLWYPHTHGEPALYDCSIRLTHQDSTIDYDIGKIGFRSIALSQEDNSFKLKVNGRDIFCRGACWTINDVVSLNGTSNDLRHTLHLMRDAGANMIRIGGTMVYEQDLFYEICDELGIMIWQDFMFANMDYPFEDNEFKDNVSIEVKQQLKRLSKYPSVVVYCGGSEVEQQIAMLGHTKDAWEIGFYQNTLPEHISNIIPDGQYVSSSPTGGELPFRTNQNLSHYYGVGAYLFPVSALRQHDVQFTSECLGFANIPIEKQRNQMFDGHTVAPTHPLWKSRVPRDTGTGWDFEDVRDHYLKTIFDLDPVELRSFDTERYLQLSELVTGEVMSQTFDEWRSSNSNCSGGIVWYLKDMWLGAGWGIIDSDNYPKSVYYYLKRKWQPVTVVMTNENLNGIQAHVINDTAHQRELMVVIHVFNSSDTIIAQESKTISINPNSLESFDLESEIGHFMDLAYSYRFGPSNIKIVNVQLFENNKCISEANHFPCYTSLINQAERIITYDIIEFNEDEITFSISAEEFLFGVTIDANGYHADDNFFYLMPNVKKIVRLQKVEETKRFKCFISAINCNNVVRVKL